MRARLLFCALYAVIMVLLAAVIVRALEPRDPNRDAVGYNVLAERMFKGTVTSRGEVVDGLMYFPLRTANATVDVQIGPKEFAERSGFKLTPGELVTVVGMPVLSRNRNLVLAREVSSMRGVLILRNEVGLPLWERNLPVLMDPVQGHS
jgi:hypothetical protein